MNIKPTKSATHFGSELPKLFLSRPLGLEFRGALQSQGDGAAGDAASLPVEQTRNFFSGRAMNVDWTPFHHNFLNIKNQHIIYVIFSFSAMPQAPPQQAGLIR